MAPARFPIIEQQPHVLPASRASTIRARGEVLEEMEMDWGLHRFCYVGEIISAELNFPEIAPQFSVVVAEEVSMPGIDQLGGCGMG